MPETVTPTLPAFRSLLRPSPQLLLLGAALLLLCTLVLTFDGLRYYWQLPMALLLAMAGLDLWQLLRMPPPKAVRQLPHNLPVNAQTTAELLIATGAEVEELLRLEDELPTSFEVEGLPAMIKLEPGTGARVSYRIKPKVRGSFDLGQPVVLRRSPWGFWQQRRKLPVATQQARVYPDFSIISSYLNMVPDQRAMQLGLHKAPRRGEGLEFHQLREYRMGDALRQIDWKATSRRRELISREYQEERDQQLVFLLDTGRRMRSQEDSLSHFDHSLNALLLLSYIALRQGDMVSVQAFGASDLWVPPIRGANMVQRLLNAVYALEPGPVASDYVTAAEHLMQRQRKRAMVILMTNLREEDEDLLPALQLLRQRHLVVLANLREQALDHVRQAEVVSFDAALRYAGTAQYLLQRQQVQRQAAQHVDLLLDCTPAQLPIQIVNGYWQIKRSGRL